MSAQHAPRVFRYTTTDKGHDVRELVIPHTGYLDAIHAHFHELQAGLVKFKFSRALPGEAVDLCIELIENEHTSRAQKSMNLLRLCNQILMADPRFTEECAARALNFLHDNAYLIGKGIVADLEIDRDDAQLRVGKEFLELVFHRLIPRIDNQAGKVQELLEQYSCYFDNFFNHEPKKSSKGSKADSLNKSQMATAQDFMRVLERCGIEIPEYFIVARTRVLEGFAKRAFDIVNNPDPHNQYSVGHLILDIEPAFDGTENPLGLKKCDPISLVSDGGCKLLIAKYHGGQMAYIFNAEGACITARNEQELSMLANHVHMKLGRESTGMIVANLLQQSREIQ
jgi:hypothetical protein